LQAQREFVAQYQILYPHGGSRKILGELQDDSAVVLNSEKWCLSFGFHIRTVERWGNLLDEVEYLDQRQVIVKRCWRLAELWQSAIYSSASVEWYTPPRYLEAAREVLGEIDLDPASSAQANVVVRATQFFSMEDDGLAQDWFGRVFMNPPYGKTADGGSLAGAFCNKAIEQYQAGSIEAGIILVNLLPSQAWQASLYDYPVCLVDHRIQFVSADGEENKSPTFQNVFTYLGSDEQRFAEVFSKIGYVMRRI
jgi:ParB family chromosome partitioning protein